jgi:hypothetical protein
MDMLSALKITPELPVREIDPAVVIESATRFKVPLAERFAPLLSATVPPVYVMSALAVAGPVALSCAVLVLDPTTKVPTDVVELAAGKVWVPLKLLPLGINETWPVVVIDVGIVSERESRPIDEITRSPPVEPATGRCVKIIPDRPSPIWSSPELIETVPPEVSVLTPARSTPVDEALEVSPVMAMPALSPEALRIR